MFFRSRQKEVESKIAEYLEQASVCMDKANKAVGDYCRSSDHDALHLAYNEIHGAESLADDLRTDIEVMLFSEALFPESRGSILELLEKLDGLPNHAESTARMLLHQHIPIPGEYAPAILELFEVSCRAADTLFKTVKQLFSDFNSATVGVGKVDQLESEADAMEANLIERVFSSDLDGFKKLMLRDFIRHISQIADRAEIVGNLIRIIVATRSI
jgi:predicted phosphate transport protein (TIGR00153 family)